MKKKSLKIDPVLCGLGRAIEVRVEAFDNGNPVFFKWTTKDKMELYSSANGKKLFCLKTEKMDCTKDQIAQRIEQNKSAVSDSVELYEKWHDFDEANGCIIKQPRGFLFNIGRATEILYASDKWTGKIKHYIHDFKKTPLVWVNNKTAPTVLILSGGKISVKKEGITG